jgi:hypothetical protein
MRSIDAGQVAFLLRNLALLLAGIALLVAGLRRSAPRRPARCPHCNRPIGPGSLCPACGKPIESAPIEPRRRPILALAGLICLAAMTFSVGHQWQVAQKILRAAASYRTASLVAQLDALDPSQAAPIWRELLRRIVNGKLSDPEIRLVSDACVRHQADWQQGNWDGPAHDTAGQLFMLGKFTPEQIEQLIDGEFGLRLAVPPVVAVGQSIEPWLEQPRNRRSYIHGIVRLARADVGGTPPISTQPQDPARRPRISFSSPGAQELTADVEIDLIPIDPQYAGKEPPRKLHQARRTLRATTLALAPDDYRAELERRLPSCVRLDELVAHSPRRYGMRLRFDEPLPARLKVVASLEGEAGSRPLATEVFEAGTALPAELAFASAKALPENPTVILRLELVDLPDDMTGLVRQHELRVENVPIRHAQGGVPMP